MSDVNVNSDAVLGDAPSEKSFMDYVPETFRDKPYLQGIDSFDKLFNQFDNAQSLIGKKTIGVPTSESPIEEWNNFYNKMGRPEKPEGYEFESIELPEELKRTEEDLALMGRIFHEAGLTKEQAKKVLAETDKAVLDYYKQNKENMDKMVEQRNKEFMSQMEKHFGKEKDQAIAVTETMLKKYVPKGMEDMIKGMDDKTMLLLSTVLHNVYKSGRAEDTLNKDALVPPAESPESLRETARKLMMSPEWKDPFHPNHDAIKKRVNSIYQKIASPAQ